MSSTRGSGRVIRLPCPPELWPELAEQLDQAFDLPPAERADWLDRVTSERPDLAEPLLRVLGAEGSPATTLPPTLAQDDSDDAPPGPGTTIGPYTLEGQLGAGGMGTVWRARRSDGAFQRVVALKLPHPHLLGGGLRERFRRERDILSRLSHPGIAQFLDAGVASDGRPFLALELVDGRPITDAANEARLDLPGRLLWFRHVLDAVAYAHARLIVHRDVKPSNVLVTAAGVVKFLDFGIAKLLEPPTAAAVAPNQLTVDGTSFVTPDFAAPEQLLGGEITVATDVWALGALLFELLTGRRPGAGRQLGVARAWEPPLASTSLDPAHPDKVGGVVMRTLSRALRGDLDAILAKALAFDPADRYPSVEALAADLERHRRQEPITARRIGALGRTRRFVRRHRLATVFTVLLLSAIGGGVFGVVRQAQATAEAARRAEATKQFLVDVFKASDPRVASGRPRGSITARELLDVAAARLAGGLAADPATRFELDLLTATIYTYLDEVDAARRILAAGRGPAEAALPAHDSRVLSALELEVWLALAAGDPATAESRLDDLDRRLRGADLDVSLHRAAYHLAASDVAAARGDLAGRRAELERAVAVYAVAAPRDSGHAAALSNLGLLALARGEPAAALGLLDRALATALDCDSDVGTDLARIQARRGRVLLALERFPEALSAYDDALTRYAATIGPGHVTVWASRAGRGRAAAHLGDQLGLDEAIADLVEQPEWDEPRLASYRSEAELQIGLGLAAAGREAEALHWLSRPFELLADDGEQAAELAIARAVVARAARGRSAAPLTDAPLPAAIP